MLKKSRCDEARQLLDKVAKQVQPIMIKRKWTVKKVRCHELADSKCGPGTASTACPVSPAGIGVGSISKSRIHCIVSKWRI